MEIFNNVDEMFVIQMENLINLGIETNGLKFKYKGYRRGERLKTRSILDPKSWKCGCLGVYFSKPDPDTQRVFLALRSCKDHRGGTPIWCKEIKFI